jgi:hypothetical protein
VRTIHALKNSNFIFIAIGVAIHYVRWRASVCENRKSPMPQLSDSKQEAFCQAFVRGPTAGNLAASYEAAGYQRDSSNAARLRATPQVDERITELRGALATIESKSTALAAAALGLDKQMVLRELARIAFANVVDYVSVDAEGRMTFDLQRLDEERSAAIRDLQVEFGDTKDTRRVTRIRVRLFDKRPALVELGRYLGMAVGRQPNVVSVPPPLEAPPPKSDEEMVARLVSNLWEFHKDGIDMRTVAEITFEGLPPFHGRPLDRDAIAAHLGLPRKPAVGGSGVRPDTS